ncbi:hypothetical protein BGP85_20660 [Pseudomonas putida]|nr:hypothetical protein BGP85_20660 [Pseudomonas putida]
MDSTKSQTKMVRAGRFSIVLPKDAVFDGALLELNGVPVAITPDYIKARVDREAQKKWLTIEERNLSNAEHKATKKSLENGAIVFKYDHTRITGEGLDGEPINKVVYSTLAYKWFNNMKFVLGNDSTLNSEKQISLILDSIPLSDMGNQQSLCYVTGCITHQTGNEGVYVDFNFAEHPNLRAKFTSKQYGGTANQYLSQRNNSIFKPADGAAWMMKSDFQHRTYRNTKRTINNLLGEEVIEASTEKSGEGYLTEVNAVWYYPGEPNSDDKPEVRFDLDYSYTTKQPPKNGAGFPDPTETDSIDEERFMRIWDEALNSLISY